VKPLKGFTLPTVKRWRVLRAIRLRSFAAAQASVAEHREGRREWEPSPGVGNGSLVMLSFAKNPGNAGKGRDSSLRSE
jgi:hypothetical protein